MALQRRAHPRAEQRLQLGNMIIVVHGADQLGAAAHRGMEIEFPGPLQRPGALDQREHRRLGHGPGLAEPEQVIIAADAGAGKARPQQAGPG